MIYCKTSVTVIWWVGSSWRALKGPDHLISLVCEGSGHKSHHYISLAGSTPCLCVRQLSTWKSKAGIWLFLCSTVFLSEGTQTLSYLGRDCCSLCVRACHREEVRLEQDFIEEVGSLMAYVCSAAWAELSETAGGTKPENWGICMLVCNILLPDDVSSWDFF